VNRFQFVEDHKDAYGVKRLCEVVEIARSSFYAWLAAAPGRAARVADDAVLATRIRVVQDPALGGDRAYGAPRVTADLNDGVTPAERVNHKRVARVMREHKLVGIRLRRRVKTTIPDQSGRRFPDLIERDFSIGEPGRRYVGDITYLPIADGTNLYLATVIDLGSRKLAGWQIADHMRTELVEHALHAAVRDRGSLAGAIFHSDHGSVYTSKAYTGLCERLKVTQSMGAIGSRRQLTGRERQRGDEARAPRGGRCDVPGPGNRLPGRVPVGEPLQHPPTPLRDRLHHPEHLRERVRHRGVGYPRGSGITEMTPCPRSGVKARATKHLARLPATVHFSSAENVQDSSAADNEHVRRHTRLGDKYVTVIADLTPARPKTGPARLLDMVEGRSKAVFKRCLAARPKDGSAGIGPPPLLGPDAV